MMACRKMNYSITSPLLAVLTVLFLFSNIGLAQTPVLPETPVVPVTDTLHRVPIVDNYRWLENGEDPQVQKWADTQDEYCRFMLKQYPGRDTLEKRIDELMKIGYVDAPAMAGKKYFYMKRIGEMDHAILYLKRTLDSEPEAVIDPNAFSADGTVALDWWFLSNDGKSVAYGKSSSGTENSTLFVRDVDTKTDLADTIPYTNGISLAWLNDNSGFYYTRLPEPGTVAVEDEVYYRKVYLHKIGTDYHNDPLVFGEGLDKTDYPGVSLSPDNRYLVMTVYKGYSISEVYLKDLQKGGDFAVLTGGAEAIFSPYPLDSEMYIFTNYQAPRYRLMKASYDKPQKENWKELIGESDATRESYVIIGDNIAMLELKNASNRISLYSIDGTYRKEIMLPTFGSIGAYGDRTLAGELDGKELLFGFCSYAVPYTIFRYDFAGDALTVFDRIETGLDLSNIEAEQVWYPSKDGTKISMFLVHKKGLNLDGNNPALVYGYGGFNVSEKPYFSRTLTIFLNKGGIYADAQLRGGGEYGEEWHRAGMLDKKQNVYDDFIAACEWLIKNKYTNPDRLVIEGGSNGGLLVGAMLVQRPDLMKAVVCGRPLLDMLRYQLFQFARAWIPEYGSAEDSAQFKYLYAYSPYHNVKKGVFYPAVLFESADHDTRVDPLHARKMTAALQAATGSKNPILLRTQRQTGHGQGAPRRIVIEETVDEWSFIYQQLGM